jgi:putative hydrolase of the HAD superfamily
MTGIQIMNTRVRVVFFDAAGTLFRVKGSVADIYLDLAQKHGFNRRPDSHYAIQEAFRRAFEEAPPPVFAATEPAEIKQCERLWWFDVVHNVFYRVGMFDRFDDFFEEVFHAFDGPAYWTLFPETESVLGRLKRAGLELGIVSNFDTRLFNVLRGLGLAGYFDTVTISSLAHAAKPAPRIFHVALEKHAAEPSDAVHVGDSLKDDVEGARTAGLTGLLLDRQSRTPMAATVIRTLDELLPLLSTLQE